MSTPHRCPICNGSGYVDYIRGMPAMHPDVVTPSTTGGTPMYICHGCGGGGIVWSPPHMEIKLV